MASHILSHMIDIESHTISHPVPVYPRSIPIPTPSAVELDELHWGRALTGPHSPLPASGPVTPAGNERPLLFQEDFLENNNVSQGWSHKANKWRVLSCCLMLFGNGLSDSAPGALLPYIEEHYKVNYAIVSLIFVAQAVGFLSAAFITDVLKNRFGVGRTFALAEGSLVLAFALIVSTPPYPVVVLAFFFIGLGMSGCLALSYVYTASLNHSTVILSLTQGMYGVGGTIGPIIATTLVSKGTLWSRYYFFTLAIALLSGLLFERSFLNYEVELRARNTTETHENLQVSSRALYIRALKYPVTILGALFTFAYQGAEVSISGWVISFLITERQGNPTKVGYVSAGFWGGITLGRFTLGPLAARVGVRRFIIGLGVAATVFQIIIWVVPNIVGDSIAVALVGYVLGPLAPLSVGFFMKLLPRSIQTIAISFITSAGSSGGAVWPFMTGLIAQSKGTYVLHPICICLFGLMLGCWVLLPKLEHRRE
jgi:fucose permease